ncbi:unnamed protein product [Dracunculus medinensis]|uniref:EF-hand domain-containing protein n=1 Tax=Dracunculus medinensis TaxID=318479 RepID=A0A0N4UQB3_DRAME|nr:unnamed protein product [Dracunculus medinensis]
MGNCKTLMQLPPKDQILMISRETGFTRRQILRLHTRFLSLDKQGRGYLDRDDFFNVHELELNPLGDRIIDAFFTEKNDIEKKLTFPEFCQVLAHFRPIIEGKNSAVNNRESKLRFAFAMYDLDKSGFITRNGFKVILSMMVGPNITPEQAFF